MYPRSYLVHERTLAGAVDSFLKGLVHVRPNLVGRFEPIADDWTEAWFAEGGANALGAVEADWIARYLETCEAERSKVEHFLRLFYQWAVHENLVDRALL